MEGPEEAQPESPSNKTTAKMKAGRVFMVVQG
jgi:hypothetical protein